MRVFACRVSPLLVILAFLPGCAANPESLVDACDRAGGTESGIRICTRSLEGENLTPHQQARILSDRGYYLALLGRYDEAIADLSRSIDLNPDMGGTYDRRGYAYRGTKNWEAALKDLDRAAEMLPDFPEAFYSRGRVHYELGNVDEAMADYDRAIKLNPKYAEAYNSRGHTYYSQKQWNLAAREYKRAIEADPKFWSAHQNLATAYLEIGEYQLAIDEYDRALELAPHNAFIYAQRSIARARLGDFDGAGEDAELFLARVDRMETHYDLDPAVFKIHSHLLVGVVHLRKAEYAAAVATFGDVIKTNPKMAQAYFFRAVANRLAGDVAGADADFRTACELDPDGCDQVRAWLQKMTQGGN